MATQAPVPSPQPVEPIVPPPSPAEPMPEPMPLS